MLCQCPHCQTQVNIPDSAAGKLVQCGKCKGTMTAPMPPVVPALSPGHVSRSEGSENSPFAFDKDSAETSPSAPIAARGNNPEIDPFGQGDLLTEEQMRTPSTHQFRLGQFLHRQQAPLIVGASFLLIGLIFVVIFISIFATRGAVPLGISGLIAFVFFGLGSLGIALSSFVYCGWKFSATPREVKIDANGMAWSNLQGDRAIAWDTVVRVWRSETITLQAGRVANWASYVRIQLTDGGAVTFDHSLTGYKELAAKIQHFTIPWILAKKSREWEDGKAEFGPITLLKEKIAVEKGANDFYKKEGIAWNDLTSWAIQNGQFDFVRPTSTCTLPLGDIPNYHVLAVLMEKITGKPSAASRSPDRREV